MGLVIGIKEGNISTEYTNAYTLEEGDHKNIVVFNSPVDVVCTIPDGLRIGFSCSILQKGLGKISFATINSNVNGASLSTATTAPWALTSVLCVSENEYTVNFSGAGSAGAAPSPNQDIVTIRDVVNQPQSVFRFTKGFMLKRIIFCPRNNGNCYVTEITTGPNAPINYTLIPEELVTKLDGAVWNLTLMCVQANFRDIEVTMEQPTTGGGTLIFVTQKICNPSQIPA